MQHEYDKQLEMKHNFDAMSNKFIAQEIISAFSTCISYHNVSWFIQHLWDHYVARLPNSCKLNSGRSTGSQS
jgi:hypothetical protein